MSVKADVIIALFKKFACHVVERWWCDKPSRARYMVISASWRNCEQWRMIFFTRCTSWWSYAMSVLSKHVFEEEGRIPLVPAVAPINCVLYDTDEWHYVNFSWAVSLGLNELTFHGLNCFDETWNIFALSIILHERPFWNRRVFSMVKVMDEIYGRAILNSSPPSAHICVGDLGQHWFR